MTELVYATTNQGKVASLQKHLAPHGFTIRQVGLTIPEPRLERVEDLAILKAMFAWQEIHQPLVALDAGFFITSLRGFPRSFVNFALETLEVDGLLRLVQEDRRCFFRHALAYHDNSYSAEVFVDNVVGTIAPEPRGVFDRRYHWSDLVRIFIPDGQTKTLGEMGSDEYQDWSERSAPKPRYADKFADWHHRHYPRP